MAQPNQRYAQLLPSYTLYGAGASVSDTSLILTSFLDINGTAITMAAFGSKGYGTIEPGSSSKEEQISFTGITANGNGTYTLTGVKTVLFIYPYTETSGISKSHAGGVKFVISNTSGYYNTFANLNNDQTFAGINTFTILPQSAATPSANADLTTKTYVDTADLLAVHKAGVETITGIKTFDTGATPLITDQPTTNLMAANKFYVDNVAVAGAPNASTTVKGIVEEATLAEMLAGTTTGGTGARLFVNPGTLAAYLSVTPDVQTFTSSGTWTKPANAKYCHIICIGAGGGGAGASLGTGGGGGGALNSQLLNSSIFQSTVTVTRGTGGTAGSSGAGGTGSASSFGAFVIAGGGTGGDATSAGGTGGTVSGTFSTGGVVGGNGAFNGAGNGGGGGAAGSAASVSIGGAAGTYNSNLGAGGNGGVIGSNYGGGAGGGTTTGFAGANGIVIVTTYF